MAWWQCSFIGMESFVWPTLCAHLFSHVMERHSLWTSGKSYQLFSRSIQPSSTCNILQGLVLHSLCSTFEKFFGVFSPTSLSGELVSLTTHFTDELMSHGLTRRILTLVNEINLTREFERLQKERGLGNEKHRKEVGGNILLLLLFLICKL